MSTQQLQPRDEEDPEPQAWASWVARSPRPGKNRIKFGPRARSVVRSVARLVNPLVLAIAGRRWMPVVGIVRHRGFRTGRAYATPLGTGRSKTASFSP